MSPPPNNMKEEQRFINNLFDVSSIPVDRKKNKMSNLKTRINEILTTSELRQESVSAETKRMLEEKIALSIKTKMPITLIVAVGGFKNWRVNTAPHIDWAEVFQLSHLIRTLYEISVIYEPGVHLEFSGDSDILSLIDNLKPEWIETYNTEFSEMVSKVAQHLPRNFKLSIRNFSDFYTLSEIQDEILKRVEQVNWSDKDVQKAINAGLLNAINDFCFDGKVNYLSQTMSSRQKLLEKSTVICKLWLEVDYEKRREYLEGGINIPIAHRKGVPGCYAIKSVKSGTVQYWEGKGILVKKDGEYFNAIISANQHLKLRSKLKSVKMKSSFNTLNSLQSIETIDFNNYLSK